MILKMPKTMHRRVNASGFLCVLLFLFIIGCSSNKQMEDTEKWSDAQAAEWFDKKEWLPKTNFQPDASIDKKDFAVRYHRNPGRWEKAFAFLTDPKLASLEVGTYEIDDKNVYAMIQEYNSKNEEDAQYESHKVYTDLQFLISGEERIGLTDLSTTTVKTPYDESKDIAFYTSEAGRTLMAKPGTFFLFFPDDAHRPGMKVTDNSPVRKLVIKIKN
jgi:YhcH/YjgK/YiaL family protein